MAEPNLASVLQAQRHATIMQQRAVKAQREAVQAGAEARRLLEEFCAAANVSITIVGEAANDDR